MLFLSFLCHYKSFSSPDCRCSALVDQCCDFMAQNLSVDNCLGIRQFADYYNCFDLRKRATRYALFHFVRVCPNRMTALSLSHSLATSGPVQLALAISHSLATPSFTSFGSVPLASRPLVFSDRIGERWTHSKSAHCHFTLLFSSSLFFCSSLFALSLFVFISSSSSFSSSPCLSPSACSWRGNPTKCWS